MGQTEPYNYDVATLHTCALHVERTSHHAGQAVNRPRPWPQRCAVLGTPRPPAADTATAPRIWQLNDNGFVKNLDETTQPRVLPLLGGASEYKDRAGMLHCIARVPPQHHKCHGHERKPGHTCQHSARVSRTNVSASGCRPVRSSLLGKQAHAQDLCALARRPCMFPMAVSEQAQQHLLTSTS